MTPDEFNKVWTALADIDAKAYAAKAAEYGDTDLMLMGRALVSHLDLSEYSAYRLDALAYEAAVAFYALGKAARVIAATSRGELANLDSWKDLVTYGMMARIRRASGSRDLQGGPDD